MNKFIIMVLTLAFFPAITIAASAELIRVIDGDTIVAKVRNNEVTLELAGIDCPELHQTGGEEAKAYTEKALSERKFSYSTKGKNKHFKALAIVTTAKGKNLNISLVQNGHARTNGKSAPKIIKNEEKKAKAAKLGIWADAPPPEAPASIEIPPRKQKTSTAPILEKSTIQVGNDTKRYDSESHDVQLEIDDRIIEGCTGTWAINEKLVYYCVDQQLASKEVVKNLEASEIKNRCQQKWGDDYRKVQSCYEQQTAVKNEVKRFGAGSKEIRECQQKWGNDIRLVNYCLENL